MNLPAVGIGILNWNGRKYLEQFLPFLQHLSYPNYSVYVIDNASSDDSIQFIKNTHPWVKIIETGGNLGFAGGYNYAFEKMQEPYLLMLNSDVEVTTGFLEPLVALMEKDEKIAACQSKMLAYHNKELFEHGGACGGMIDVLGYTFCRGRIFDTVEKDENQYQTSDVFWAGGACSLIRRSAYTEVNGMYEYFFMHFEEIDMCWKFHAAGYKVYCSNESVVYHVGGASLSYQSPKKTYYNFRNNLVMCARNAPLSYKIWWVPVRLLTDMMSVLFFMVKGEGKHALAVLKAYGAFMKWMFSSKAVYSSKRISLTAIPGVFKHSIIAQYFLARNKKYSQIVVSGKQ
jgi:GT2 family glycosyltransferase